jgi:CheY-like chemotaxis protein
VVFNGHVVHESASAESAIDAILTATPGVILLDLRLPGMDGLSLVRQLKASEETRGIPSWW